MRFNSKRYPLLVKDNWFNYTIPDSIICEHVELYRKNPDIFIKLFRERVDLALESLFQEAGTKFGYVSSRFCEDAFLNQEKFSSLDFCNEINNEPYKLLLDGMVYIGCYPKWGAIFKHDKLLCFCRQTKHRFVYVEYSIPISSGSPVWHECILTPRSILLFKKYAPHKTKVLPPKGKVKEFHCKYKSDLDIELDLYTENWYTESLQKMPYKVRDHLRWQRVGKGRKARRLTWVKSHMRSKYKKGAYNYQ